jgi:hypothetical protein
MTEIDAVRALLTSAAPVGWDERRRLDEVG